MTKKNLFLTRLFLFTIIVAMSLHSMDPVRRPVRRSFNEVGSLGDMFFEASAKEKGGNEPNLPTQLAQISSFKEFNNFCEHTKYTQNEITYAANSKILAYCVQKYLPQDLVKNNIIPYFSKSLAKKYRYKALDNKCHENAFTIAQTSDNKNTYIIEHDGKYTLAPSLYDEYTTWKYNVPRYAKVEQYDKTFFRILLPNSKNNIKCSLELNNTDQLYYLTIENKNNKRTRLLSSPKYSLGHLFSYDNSLLLCRYNGYLILYDLTEADKGIIHTSWPAFAATIMSIYAAHKSPLFVATNNNWDPDRPNVCFIEKNALHYHSTYKEHRSFAHIEDAQFNSDDTQLLIHLWDIKSEESIFQLWDTRDHKHPNCISEYVHHDKIKKTYFMKNKDTIITIRSNGTFDIINLASQVTSTHYKHELIDEMQPYPSYYSPLILIDDKNNLLINATINTVHFFLPEKNKRCITLSIPEKQVDITGIGLTKDNKIITEFNNNQKKVYQFEPYTQKERNIINYIKNKATMAQIYHIFALTKQYKGKKNSLALINAINAYIDSSIDSEELETNENNKGFITMISEFLFSKIDQ